MSVAEPGIVWWQGPTACSICGYGTPGHAVPYVQSVVPIPEGQDMPVVPLECPGCGNRTLNPIDDDEDEDDG